MTRTECLDLAKAAHLRNTASREAARMVLTGDMRPGEAAQAAGCSQQAVTNALSKIKVAIAATGNAQTTAPMAP